MPIQPLSHQSILISRTDSIGDVILTIPITYALKQLFPKNKIIFLSSSYTKPILQYIQTIDEIIDYNNFKTLSLQEQKNIIQTHHVHSAVIVFPAYEISQLLFKLKIPYRIATAHRWYNWLYANKLVFFSRKNSDLHESQLNFHLLKPFGINTIPSLEDISKMFQLKDIPPLPSQLNNLIDKNKFKLILHPKSKGSAREWSVDNYIHLIKKLDLSKFQIFITGTNNELPFLEKIFAECPQVINLVGKTTLDELISLINTCDGLVAASTGTLHLAAVLNKHAIGIFPPIRPMHPGRWSPVGKHTHVFCVNKSCNDCKNNPSRCSCIQQISPDEIANLLYSLLKTQ